MKNKPIYIRPSITVEIISLEQGIAAGSSFITVEGSDGGDPLVEEWTDGLSIPNKTLDF